MMALSELLIDIMKSYKTETMQGRFGKEHRMFKLLNYTVKDEISDNITDNNLIVKGSAGQGGWTTCPWIAVYNKNITTTIQEGIYIVYLFSEDMTRVYLTLNQGCTNLKKQLGQRKATEVMIRVRDEIKNKINNKSFYIDNNLQVGNKDYEVGCIFYNRYDRNNMPQEQQLISDLKEMIDIYMEYYNKFILGNTDEESGEEHMDNNINETKQIIESVRTYILSKSFIYSYSDLANFYLSLKSKPFVILAGVSGTGKSKLVRLFAEAVGATVDNGQFKMISVKPDWNDNTELFGYKNIAGDFIPGQLTSIILETVKPENKHKPYFICLDEMNLARVEYYLSDYLSLIESREFWGQEIITDKLFSKGYHKEDSEYNNIYLPDNLYLIGTVNMDDTTYAFSRKVLDRANTIEFSAVNLEELNFEFTNEVRQIVQNNDFLKTRFLNISDALTEDTEYVKAINDKVIEINNIMKKGNRHFGYRVRDEIVFYMLENKISSVIEEEDTAFDYVVMQKVLPTINGSDAKIKDILVGLYNICNPEKPVVASSSNYINEAEKFLGSAKYRKSAAKIIDMLRGYEDGFASYWI
jgi:5-methylcytosine-specific restriction enzyme B